MIYRWFSHRYEDTKSLADQLPFVKTVKPDVKMTMMQKTRAAGVEYAVGCRLTSSRGVEEGVLTSPPIMPRQ